jgi:hypothetical protein
MDDDLDTVMALKRLHNFAVEIEEAAGAGRSIAAAQAELRKMASVFGLRLTKEGPEERVLAGWSKHLERFT